MTNPYSKLNVYQYWRRSVSRVETHQFDPVTHVKFRICQSARVATAGSCFAQHISKKLREINFAFHVGEKGEKFSPHEQARRQYGVFSARYGNIYTTTQLRQLFDEAFGLRSPVEPYFTKADGRFVDVLRQMVEPDGFASIDELVADRREHLAAVREIFTTTDVFVFTLGLTEAWRSKLDGTVIPTAPGVLAESKNASDYEYINFGVADVLDDLNYFLGKIKKINPGISVILTVSPVPLIATYEDKSVLVATTYSKAVLRVVAELASKDLEWVDYFPSYEIITGSYAGGLYYEDDYREVNSIGVAHAMRCFLKNYVEEALDARHELALLPTTFDKNVVICDEEALDAVKF